MAALDRPRKDLREADLDLLEREPMRVAGGAIARSHGCRDARGPAIEERLHVGRPQRIADGLQARGVGAREKAIVETVERDPLPPQLLLHPLVAVEAQLDRIREIRPKLEKGWAPVRILNVEVVVIDRDRLPREVERHSLAPTR